jgi:hypothetical protein
VTFVRPLSAWIVAIFASVIHATNEFASHATSILITARNVEVLLVPTAAITICIIVKFVDTSVALTAVWAAI